MPAKPSNPLSESGASGASMRAEAAGFKNSSKAEAVRTFEFEVGAGQATQANFSLPEPIPKKPNAARKDLLPQGDRQQVDQQKVDREHEVDSSQVVVMPVHHAAKKSSWWITSLWVHVLLIAGLAFWSLDVVPEEQIELYASPVVLEPVEEIEDLEIELTDELDSLEEELEEELNVALSDLDPDILANLESEIPFETLPLKNLASGELASAGGEGNLADLSPLFGKKGPNTDPNTGKAKFFGTEIQARRILYMLDNSGGMRKGGKFEALVSELQTSISRLDPKQQFYVIFYSDTFYPLFYPYSVYEFAWSTPMSQNRLSTWLDSVELCTGNAIDEALAAAEKIRPDAVFLLTDGNLFTTDEKEALLLYPADRSYPIHTFGLGVSENSRTADRLKAVAEANGGTFRAIKISDKMKATAKERMRLYHNKKPGSVWGKKVGIWR